MTTMISTGHILEAYGYTFVLNESVIAVFDYERQVTPVAIRPVLDDNGHRRVHTLEDFETEVAYFLRDWT